MEHNQQIPPIRQRTKRTVLRKNKNFKLIKYLVIE